MTPSPCDRRRSVSTRAGVPSTMRRAVSTTRRRSSRLTTWAIKIPYRPAGEPSDRHTGADPAGGAAGPGRQQGPARCPQLGARPYPACQPGRLVRASPGGHGASQQCQGFMVEPLAGRRKPLVSGEIGRQGAGWTPGAMAEASTETHTACWEAAARRGSAVDAGRRRLSRVLGND